MFKKILLSPWTAVITLIICAYIRLINPSFVESVRLTYFDTLITSQEPVQNNIHTVNIDDPALNEIGAWPVPRDYYAELITDLYANRNAGLVVLNVLMPGNISCYSDQCAQQVEQEYTSQTRCCYSKS
jgi:CHASE2 domain-containing sensor protein